MKKLLCILGFLIGSFAVFAQNPNAYRFSFDTTTYVELSNPTVVGQKLVGTNLNKKWIVGDTGYAAPSAVAEITKIPKQPGYAIGFDFPFAKETFKYFGILSNGAIFLGNNPDSLFVGTSSYGPLNAAFTANVISMGTTASIRANTDGLLTNATPYSEISYLTEGSEGSKTLTVQFKNILVETAGSGSSIITDTVNFQIILHQSGKITYHFGKSIASNTLTKSFSIGIKSTSASTPDYLTRSISSSTGSDQNWSNSANGSSASATCAFMAAKYPTMGLRYIFDTPIACTTPDAIATSISFNSLTTNSFKFSVGQNPNSDGSIAIWSDKAVLTAGPENGKSYKYDAEIGGGHVAATSSSANGEFSGTVGNSMDFVPLPGTKYYLHVYSFNTLCVGNTPIYSTTAKIDSLYTLPGATEISLVSSDSTKATLALEIFKDYSVAVFKSSSYNATPAEPTKEMNIGDTLSDGSILVYKGKDTEIVINNLKKGSLNYFTTRTMASESTYGPDFRTIGVQMIATTLPFTFDFINQPAGVPIGWDGNFQIFTTSQPTYKVLSVSIPKCSMGGDSCLTTEAKRYTSLSSPFTLGKGKQRLSFDYIIGLNGKEASVRPSSPAIPMAGVELPDRDSLLLSVTTDGINFTPIGHISSTTHAEANPNFTTTAMYIDDLNFKQIQLRIEAVSKGSIAYSYFIQNLTIKEALTDCEAPVSIAIIDSTVTTTQAQLKWTDAPGNKYNEWNISYKKSNEENWSEAINIKEKPYTINYLEPQSTYAVRIQTVCSKEVSEWSSSSMPFTTKYGVPFGANFAKKDWNDSVFPTYWSRMRGILPEQGVASFFTDSPTSWIWWNWKNIQEGHDAFRCGFGEGAYYWFMTPAFDLEKNNKTLLNFDFALTENIDQNSVDTVNKNSRFLVIISTDGGKTFHVDNTLIGYGKGTTNRLSNLDSVHVSIPLKNYSGNVKIGFYVENPTSSGVDAFIQLAHLSVAPSCLTPTKPTVSDITQKTAKLHWESNTANEWIIRYKTNTESAYTYMSVDGNPATLTNLMPATLTNLMPSTTYEWGVRTVCQAEDSSAWLSASFATLDPYICDTVKRARRIDYDKTFAQLAWVGDAYSYNFKYKKPSESTWTTLTTQDTTIILENLEIGTTYEFSVQSQCSDDKSDTSIFIHPVSFKTAIVSCPVPDSLRITEVKFMSVSINWVKNASNYQYNYKVDTAYRWDGGFIGDYGGIGINGLLTETNYQYRMRSICTQGDTSEWSPILSFRTTAVPECSTPVNIKAASIDNSSATLSWEPGVNNILYHVRTRQGLSDWDTILRSTEQTSFIYANLQPETTYTWSIQGICDTYFLYNVISSWSENQKFTTTPISIEGEADLKGAFQISGQNGQIHILNPGQKRIDKVEIFSTAGQAIGNYRVVSSDNVIIPTHLNGSLVVLRITCEGGIVSYKLYL